MQSLVSPRKSEMLASQTKLHSSTQSTQSTRNRGFSFYSYASIHVLFFTFLTSIQTLLVFHLKRMFVFKTNDRNNTKIDK